MAIIRTKRVSNYTVIDNQIFIDNGLSFGAIGLLTTLLSKPDNWNVSVRFLVDGKQDTAKPVGNKSVYALLDELIEHGYVQRTKKHNGTVEYKVFDVPQPHNSKPNSPNGKQPYGLTAVTADSPKPKVPQGCVLINTETTTSTEKEITSTENSNSAELLPDADASRSVSRVKKTKRYEAPITELVALYNEVTSGTLSAVQEITSPRKSQLNARWLQMKNSKSPSGKVRYVDEQSGLKWWETFFRKVLLNDTWNGNNSINFAANFDWIIKQSNFVKVLEWRPTLRQIEEQRHAS